MGFDDYFLIVCAFIDAEHAMEFETHVDLVAQIEGYYYKPRVDWELPDMDIDFAYVVELCEKGLPGPVRTP